MLDIVTAAYNNMQHNLYTGLLLVNLRKAFDTVCHKTLLHKLKNNGIRRVIDHNLISSYLSNSKQFVSLNQTCSLLKNIGYAVPQRSSLSLLLFLTYINS